MPDRAAVVVSLKDYRGRNCMTDISRPAHQLMYALERKDRLHKRTRVSTYDLDEIVREVRTLDYTTARDALDELIEEGWVEPLVPGQVKLLHLCGHRERPEDERKGLYSHNPPERPRPPQRRRRKAVSTAEGGEDEKPRSRRSVKPGWKRKDESEWGAKDLATYYRAQEAKHVKGTPPANIGAVSGAINRFIQAGVDTSEIKRGIDKFVARFSTEKLDAPAWKVLIKQLPDLVTSPKTGPSAGSWIKPAGEWKKDRRAS